MWGSRLMIGMLFFLFALIAAVIYYFLGRIPTLLRVLVSIAAFVILSGLFSSAILKIGDQASPNAITITPEMMSEAAKHKKK